MPRAKATLTLSECYVISLRPVNDHAALRRAAARLGARVLALSPWKIATQHDAHTCTALRTALAADCVIATSPAAVRAAQSLMPLRARRGQTWCAVGSGTAAALRRAGVARVESPSRMDSDGLLALPALCDVRGRRIGLLTAPGGADRIAPALRRRGAQVLRADVYARVPVAASARALATLHRLDAPLLLPVSSGEALQRTLAAVPAEIASKLRRARVIAASGRLAELARSLGFDDVRIADSPRPAALLAAAARHA